MQALTLSTKRTEKGETNVIDLTKLPEPVLPHWAKTKVLNGQETPSQLILPNTLDKTFCFGSKMSGKSILGSLVSCYNPSKGHNKGTRYPIQDFDTINGHYGLKALVWLEQHWTSIPAEHKYCIDNMLIYGWSDVVEDDGGNLNVPYLVTRVETPRIGWYGIDRTFFWYERALCNVS